MKNRLYSVAISAFFVIPFVALREGGPSKAAGAATNGLYGTRAVAAATASFMPVLDTDFSDLDVRDAQNRPVSNLQALENLTDLFRQTLFNLGVAGDLHGMSLIWSDLELFSRLFHDLIFNTVYPIFQAVPKALLTAQKRFVHNVHNLWIAVSVGVSVCDLMATLRVAKSTSQPLILRC
jgi:hypothetical protein